MIETRASGFFCGIAGYSWWYLDSGCGCVVRLHLFCDAFGNAMRSYSIPTVLDSVVRMSLPMWRSSGAALMPLGCRNTATLMFHLYRIGFGCANVSTHVALLRSYADTVRLSYHTHAHISSLRDWIWLCKCFYQYGAPPELRQCR